MALSAREAQLVHDGWEIVIMPNYEKTAMEWFLDIFAKDPTVMDRFPFIQDLPDGELVENNQRLQKHATIALLMVGDAIACFGSEEEATMVKKRLHLLGRLHVKFGLQESYFMVVRSCFVDIIRKAFRSLWDSEMEKAWTNAIVIVTDELIGGLREGYAA